MSFLLSFSEDQQKFVRHVNKEKDDIVTMMVITMITVTIAQTVMMMPIVMTVLNGITNQR